MLSSVTPPLASGMPSGSWEVWDGKSMASSGLYEHKTKEEKKVEEEDGTIVLSMYFIHYLSDLST